MKSEGFNIVETQLFINHYNSIKYFCETAKEGFVVVEVNSEIIKEDLFCKLSSDLPVCYKKLSDFSNNQESTLQNHIIIVDEFDTNNSTDMVVNLNYNRNWFLNLHCIFIFVLRTSAVTDLISYSESFWSFVTLHKTFTFKFNGIMQPRFIFSDRFGSYMDEFSQNYYDQKERGILNKRIKSSDIILNLYSNVSGQTRPIDVLKSEFLKIEKKCENNIEKAVESFVLLAFFLIEDLRRAGYKRDALDCIEYIDNKITIHEAYIELEIRRLMLLSEVYFSLDKYDDVLAIYKKLSKIIETRTDDRRKIVILNNTGVVYFKKKLYSKALDYFYEAIKIQNDQCYFDFGVSTLYNLSLLHYQIDDYYNAQYFIDKAIDILNGMICFNTQLLILQCKVFKAYLLVNLGDLKNAKNMLRESINYIRNDETENSMIAMETHYAFATLYLHNNELENAESCAIKAESIMKKNDSPFAIRCHIRELLGEIYFYSNEYTLAKKYLQIAYSHSIGKHYFSEDVLEWIKQLIEFCVKFA